MNNNSILALERFSRTYLEPMKEDINEDIVKETVLMFAETVKKMFGNVSEDEIKKAIINLEQYFAITHDTGSMLKEDNYAKWYFNSKDERETKYWDRYHRYLQEDANLPEVVINKIDESSEEIMDVLGDPQSNIYFQRKGLVIGAVQSGKTSNYIGLINKATDSGYKVIILLTGTIEKLRQQTQGRVDEGFVGFDSKQWQQAKKKGVIGAGKYDPSLNVTSFTTTEKDFNLRSEVIQLKAVNGPAIFVIKKNKSILERLEEWLREQNADSTTKKIDMPLLLIDDEADNASINTSNPDKDPTKINTGIRNLLKLFTKFSYVGFTATPFANIFIDPQLDKETREDLFPKDFIYLLEQPSNYVGPNDMYDDDGKYHYMIRYNDDVENILPLKHKNGTNVPKLPSSLENAILLFFISNAVRDLRGQDRKHRSMLIHISRFIFVQNSAREQVDKFVRTAKINIKNYAFSDVEHPFIKRIRILYMEEYGTSNKEECFEAISESWEEIKSVLHKSVSPIQVKIVNSGTASKNLNYDEYEDGLRIIAVGGLSLARGLTLEGLMISYFYRNTKMYDTLMQMGRWFGYRNGYVDLCRLWTSEESAGWYGHIAAATEELRLEIKKMAAQNKKPEEFGLRVRSSEDTPLIITARNKMKNTENVTLTRSLNGKMIETAILPSRIDEIEANNSIIENWIRQNEQFMVTDSSLIRKKKPTFKNVPKQSVMGSLLSLLEFPYINEFSKDSGLVKEINASESKLFDKWDVVIATNDGKEGEQSINFGNLEIFPVHRSFDFFGSGRYVRMSGSKKRLGSTDYATGGLTPEQYKLIQKNVDTESKGKAPHQNMYFNTGIDRNPLIVIYPVQLKLSKDSNNIEIDEYVNKIDCLITGISIGIPDIKGLQSVTYEYTINKVYQMELIEGTSNPKEWDNTEDEDDDNLLDD